MATGRITAAGLASNPGKGRITAAGLSSTLGMVGRITTASALSAAARTLTLPSLAGVEPNSAISVSASVNNALSTTYTWSCDYAGLSFTTTGGTLTYTAPATRNGTTITWTVVAHQSGQADLTTTATHTVYPHIGGWTYSTAGALYPVLVGA